MKLSLFPALIAAFVFVGCSEPVTRAAARGPAAPWVDAPIAGATYQRRPGPLVTSATPGELVESVARCPAGERARFLECETGLEIDPSGFQVPGLREDSRALHGDTARCRWVVPWTPGPQQSGRAWITCEVVP